MRNKVIILMMLISSGLLFISFFFPWWRFKLYAPQYPDGLYLKVYLNNVKGDVSEIDILNHYIGMKKLEEAAKFERKIAFPSVVVVAFLPFVSLLRLRGNTLIRRFFALFCLAPAGFLGGFVAGLFYWLWRFGHDLNPSAPIKIQPFTPKLLGWGSVAQFKTFAMFDTGFFIALAASILGIISCLILPSSKETKMENGKAILGIFSWGRIPCGKNK